MQGALLPRAATVPPVVRAGRAARGRRERTRAAAGRPGKGRGGQVSAAGLVTAQAPQVSLASTVRCAVILTSERPCAQDKPVLGQKVPQVHGLL